MVAFSSGHIMCLFRQNEMISSHERMIKLYEYKDDV